MRKDVKDAWIKKLLSGEYKQTRHRLRRVVDGQDCFCALGLLGEVLVEKGVCSWKLSENEQVYKLRLANSGENICGIHSELDEYLEWDTKQQDAIWEKNDCEVAGFVEIAQFVEENY